MIDSDSDVSIPCRTTPRALVASKNKLLPIGERLVVFVLNKPAAAKQTSIDNSHFCRYPSRHVDHRSHTLSIDNPLTIFFISTRAVARTRTIFIVRSSSPQIVASTLIRGLVQSGSKDRTFHSYVTGFFRSTTGLGRRPRTQAPATTFSAIVVQARALVNLGFLYTGSETSVKKTSKQGRNLSHFMRSCTCRDKLSRARCRSARTPAM